MTYQVDAAEQLLKKVEAIENDMRIVEKALGVGSDAEWSDIFPVVLNGMPISLPGMVNGVYYMDFASLERFFESGKLHPLQPDSNGTSDFSDSDEPVDLWASHTRDDPRRSRNTTRTAGSQKMKTPQ